MVTECVVVPFKRKYRKRTGFYIVWEAAGRQAAGNRSDREIILKCLI